MAWNDVLHRSAWRPLAALGLAACAAALTGCSVALPRESPINDLTQDAPSALQIYRAHAGGPGNVAGSGPASTPALTSPATSRAKPADWNARDALERDAVERTGGLRTVANADGLGAPQDGTGGRYWSALEPMRQRFAKVPNPDLVMVVYPHLAQGKYPVPGYVTTFPMYEETNYALPGEIQEDMRRTRERFTPKPGEGAVDRATMGQEASAGAAGSWPVMSPDAGVGARRSFSNSAAYRSTQR